MVTLSSYDFQNSLWFQLMTLNISKIVCNDDVIFRIVWADDFKYFQNSLWFEMMTLNIFRIVCDDDVISIIVDKQRSAAKLIGIIP